MTQQEPSERGEWLAFVRARCERRMDTLFAPTYDEQWGAYSNVTHQAMVERMLTLLPRDAAVLDAPCGTGKYWPQLLAAGCSVHGVDQSAGMLAQARAKFPDVPTEKRGLQDLNAREAYAGVFCIDAMENISPEDWPVVLERLTRALAPEGLLYLTVELEEPEKIKAAYDAARARGIPVVQGEVAHEGGYHYYPTLEQVRDWLAHAGLRILDERAGEGYQHYLTRKAGN